ncbi:hypothetical protein DH2020_011701 [Rehmannia glutinosa]|uniref:C2 domain-containing protein n=1 Tax=Rehmannia glutinosa TaxID=99300 RepID=A0ABR0XEQ4_REHGL
MEKSVDSTYKVKALTWNFSKNEMPHNSMKTFNKTDPLYVSVLNDCIIRFNFALSGTSIAWHRHVAPTVHEGYVLKLRKKLQFEEKRESNQRRVLSESETVRWLNHAIEKMWLVCMEEIVSQKILLPIFPWFLKKYKPWTVVLELGMNFRTADDMSAILGVKLRKRLGFGMWAKLHMLGMHVEGKVLVGVKFLRGWPFISRLRVCFAGPPYFQMTVKPIFTHGLDVTELPGIAGWIPNMLVVDVEKFASPQSGILNLDVAILLEPIAYAIVEVLEAAEMKPSDMNGLADPYVKGQLGPYRFRTKTMKKTLAPMWREEFKIPICTWESENMLAIEVRDKDHIFDDMMGDGQRHDMWLPLQNIKMGRLHLAVTVTEGTGKVAEPACDADGPDSNYRGIPSPDDSSQKGSFSSKLSEKSQKVADKFEPIEIDGQSETGIWIHHPGTEVAQKWEPRKGKSRHVDSQHLNGDLAGSFKSSGPFSSQNDGSSTDESTDLNKPHSMNPVRKGLKKISSVFHRSPRGEDKSNALREAEPSPHDNIKALNAKDGGVRWITDDTIIPPSPRTTVKDDEKELGEESGPESPHQGHAKDVAKSILKQAGKSARSLKYALSRKASRKTKSTDKDAILEQDSSDDESLSSATDTVLAEPGLVIPGSAVSSPALVSDNNSVKLKDSVVQTENLSGNDSLMSTDDDTVRTGVGSDNISFNSGDDTVQTPK